MHSLFGMADEIPEFRAFSSSPFLFQRYSFSFHPFRSFRLIQVHKSSPLGVTVDHSQSLCNFTPISLHQSLSFSSLPFNFFLTITWEQEMFHNSLNKVEETQEWFTSVQKFSRNFLKALWKPFLLWSVLAVTCSPGKD